MVTKAIKPDEVDDKQIKQTIEERKQDDIEELCLLLSYEKDLTGSEKIHRDTIISRIFEEGDIPKMRAVEEKLSKKASNKWTQSERSFNEQVQRYGTEEEKLDTIEGTGNLVIAQQLKDFGWTDTSDAFVDELNDTLIRYGITDKASIVQFIATMAAESAWGYYTIEQGSDDYFNNQPYGKNERGAGYIQITWSETHLNFLKSMGDTFSGNDTATYIANNYPMEAAAWFWSNAAKTSEGNLNAYSTKNGNSLGDFLCTQYYVNGLVVIDGKVPQEFKGDLASISNGEAFTINKDANKNSTSLSINGHTWRLPNHWDDRVYAYNEAIGAFK